MSKSKVVYPLYFIALVFAGLSFFLQVLPVNTAEHFQQTLSLSPAKVIQLTSLYLIAYAIMQIPIGIIFDKFGVKWVLPFGLFLTGLGSFFYLLGTNEVVLGLGRAFTGIGCSVGYISGIFIAVKYFPARRLPIFISLVEGVSTLGAMLATTTFNKLLINFGWNIANMSIVVLCIVLLVLSIFFGWTITYEQQAKRSFGLAMQQAFLLVKNKRLLAIFIYSFCTWLIIMSFAGYWIKNYMVNMHQYTVEEALKLASYYWAAFFVANITIGFFVESLKGCKIAIFLLALLSFLDYLFMSIPELFTHNQLITVIILGGISTSGVIMAFSIIPKIVSEELSGTALAVNNTFIILGGYVGQVLFGNIVDNPHFFTENSIIHARNIDPHYYSAILIYPLFAFIGLVAVVFAIRKLK